MAVQDYMNEIQSAVGGYKNAAEGAANTYANTVGQSGGLAAKLKDALGKKLNYNEDIIKQQNAALGDYIAAPATARANYQNVWNPFEREKLVAQARSQAFQPYATYSDVLQQRMGQVSDIVNEGVSGWQAIVQQAQALAQLAQQRYSDAMSEYMNAAGLQNQADTKAENARQFNETMAWNKDKFAQELSNKGSGTATIGTNYAGQSASDQNAIKTYASAVASGMDLNDVPSKYRLAVLQFTQNTNKGMTPEYKAGYEATQAALPAAQKTMATYPGSFQEKASNWLKYIFSEDNPRNKYPMIP
jgi:hypothetical protein